MPLHAAVCAWVKAELQGCSDRLKSVTLLFGRGLSDATWNESDGGPVGWDWNLGSSVKIKTRVCDAA